MNRYLDVGMGGEPGNTQKVGTSPGKQVKDSQENGSPGNDREETKSGVNEDTISTTNQENEDSNVGHSEPSTSDTPDIQVQGEGNTGEGDSDIEIPIKGGKSRGTRESYGKVKPIEEPVSSAGLHGKGRTDSSSDNLGRVISEEDRTDQAGGGDVEGGTGRDVIDNELASGNRAGDEDRPEQPSNIPKNPGYQSNLERLRQLAQAKKVGVGTEISEAQVIAWFKKLPLDRRLDYAIQTLAEFDRLQHKYGNVLDRLGMKSPRVMQVIKQTKEKKKPVDRIIDLVFGFFQKYMESGIKGNLSEDEKNQLKMSIRETLEKELEGEDEE